MKSAQTLKLTFVILCIMTWSACSNSAKTDKGGGEEASAESFVSQTPTEFEVDPHWPMPLPNNWILGEVSGIVVDEEDHVWIIHRPLTVTDRVTGAAQDPPTSECCIPAPSVIEFDPEGNVLQAWGNQGEVKPWPVSEHGICVDHEGNVWIGGRAASDHVVLKLSNNGELLLTIGEWGRTNGSNDTRYLGGPTDITVDAGASEVYITDGYDNRRVIVFDSNTGEYKRHWGAYGEPPDDGELPGYDPDAEPARSFRSPVHTVNISNDGLVYVTDRAGDRFQVFKKDGSFVTEAFVARQTLDRGSVWDIAFSPDPDQTYLYIPDGMNMKVWILDRKKLQVVGSFGQGGRNAGQFGWVHSIAMDSKGNLYTGEVTPGKRVQKFRPVASASMD